MTDPTPPQETQAPVAPAAQTPEAESVPQGQAQEQPAAEEPKFVTQEQLDQAVADAVRNVKMADKQRAGQIKKEIASIKDVLEATGLTITPEQEAKLESQVVTKYADDDEPESPSAGTASPEGDPLSGQPQEVVDAIRLMELRGVTLAAGVPEFDEMVKPILDSGNLTTLKAVTDQAIDKFKARTVLQKEKAPLRVPEGAGGPAPQTRYDPTRTPESYLEQYQKEKASRK